MRQRLDPPGGDDDRLRQRRDADRDAGDLRRDARPATEGQFAYPAINVTSSQTLNAALRGFAEAESDGIIQVSTGGAGYFSGRGPGEKGWADMVTGGVAFARFAHEEGQAVASEKLGLPEGSKPFVLVFHGGTRGQGLPGPAVGRHHDRDLNGPVLTRSRRPGR